MLAVASDAAHSGSVSEGKLLSTMNCSPSVDLVGSVRLLG